MTTKKTKHKNNINNNNKKNKGLKQNDKRKSKTNI